MTEYEKNPNPTKDQHFLRHEETLKLKGNPPLGTCSICIGSKKIGWQNCWHNIIKYL